MNPSPSQKFTGYWIPVELSKLGLTKIEQFLLAMIDSLDSGDPDYCFASNAYLANQMELSESRISFYITKFKKMKLIEEVSFSGRVRRLKSLKHNWYKTEYSKKELCVKTIRQTTRVHVGRLRESTQHIENLDNIEEKQQQSACIKDTNDLPKKDVVVVSFSLEDEEKIKMLDELGITLSKMSIDAYIKKPIEVLKSAILGYKEFIATTDVQNRVGCLRRFILEEWKPNTKKEDKSKEITKKSNDLNDLILTRKYDAEKYIKENWTKFKISSKPRTHIEYIEIGNDKLYYKDNKYEELFKHYMRKSKE